METLQARMCSANAVHRGQSSHAYQNYASWLCQRLALFVWSLCSTLLPQWAWCCALQGGDIMMRCTTRGLMCRPSSTHLRTRAAPTWCGQDEGDAIVVIVIVVDYLNAISFGSVAFAACGVAGAPHSSHSRRFLRSWRCLGGVCEFRFPVRAVAVSAGYSGCALPWNGGLIDDRRAFLFATQPGRLANASSSSGL